MADAGADLIAGGKYVGALDDATRKNTAFNALAAIYGPTALDPEAATTQATMQQVGFNNQTMPGKVASTNALNANTPQQISDTNAENANIIAEGKFKNAFSAETQPGAIAATNATNANVPQQISDTNAQNANTVTAGQQTNAYTAATQPGRITATNATNAQVPVDALLSTQSKDLANQKTQQDINQAVALAPGVIAQQSAELGLTQAQATKATADAQKAAGAAGGGSEGLTPTRRAILGSVSSQIDAAEALVHQMPTNSTLRAAMAHVPGSAVQKYEALVKSIQGNVAIQDMLDAKAKGVGMSRTTNTEFTAAGGALGSLDPSGDPATVLQNLEHVRGFTANVLARDETPLATSATPAGAASSAWNAGVHALAGNAKSGAEATANATAAISQLAGVPIQVKSGYRTAAENKAAHGSATSEHMQGSPTAPEAWDFVDPTGKTPLSTMAIRVAHGLSTQGIPFDQVEIDPTNNHVHVAFGTQNRNQIVTPTGHVLATVKSNATTQTAQIKTYNPQTGKIE
jgi:hypothetical protein